MSRARVLLVVLFGGVALLAACAAPEPPDDLVVTALPQAARAPDAGPSAPPPPPSPPVDTADASAPGATPACAATPPTNRCGLVPQCGCGANETCDVTNDATGATSCVTAGSGTLGRPCAQTGDCLAGLTCEYGACRPYCGAARSKCAAPGTDLCVEILGEGGKAVANKNVCTINCDPREPTAVCGSNACHWLPDYYAPSKVSDCNFGGAVAELDACKTTSDCKPGLACTTHPTYGLECERWCRIGVAGDCGSDPAFKCKDVFGGNAPIINGVKEGICQD